MPKGYPRKNCRECGVSSDEVGQLTATYLCLPCAQARESANIEQLQAHRGPFFKHWRRRSAAALGAIPVEDLIERTG